MSAKPILTLTSKDFLNGLSTGAHIGTGGILFKADGITPIYDASGAQSPNNGLLMAGASGTQVLGNLNGTIISSAPGKVGGPTSLAFFGTSTGHIFQLTVDSTFASTLTDIHNVTALRQGLIVFDGYLFYFRDTNIGRYDLVSTFTDAWDTISSDSIHCTHQYFDVLLYGNSQTIGQIDSAFSNNKSKLTIGGQWPLITDISDDGTYAVIAVTDNLGRDATAMSDTQVLFWDGFSTQWQRQYPIPDPYIIALEKTPNGVFAFGVTGIWQVTFGGVKKVFSIPPGMYTAGSYTNLMYGTYNASHYGDALLWSGASGSNAVVKTLGKLGDAPSSYLHPFLSTAGKNITMVDAQLLKGYVYVADDTPLLKAYPFSIANVPATGVSAQTIYFELPEPYDIEKIRVVFGEPLASGDSLTISASSDEDTSATSFGTIAYSAAKTIRSKTLFKKLTAEDQLSLTVSFDAGAEKIKKIEVFGEPRERTNT